jgi:hypothetical protein
MEVAEMTTETRQQTDINDLLLCMSGLVRARELLEHRDANDLEFRATDARIEQLHWQLARIMQAEQNLQHAA